MRKHPTATGRLKPLRLFSTLLAVTLTIQVAIDCFSSARNCRHGQVKVPLLHQAMSIERDCLFLQFSAPVRNRVFSSQRVSLAVNPVVGYFEFNS